MNNEVKRQLVIESAVNGCLARLQTALDQMEIILSNERLRRELRDQRVTIKMERERLSKIIADIEDR